MKDIGKKGEVRGNLTEEEKDGLKRLQKRIKDREVIIMKTDKSGKLCLITREEYEKMGEEHERSRNRQKRNNGKGKTVEWSCLLLV